MEGAELRATGSKQHLGQVPLPPQAPESPPVPCSAVSVLGTWVDEKAGLLLGDFLAMLVAVETFTSQGMF